MPPKGATTEPGTRAPGTRPGPASAGGWSPGHRWILAASLALGTAGMSATCATAEAASAQISDKRLLPYPYETVWPTAVRYLRVDRGYAVKDASEAAGYVLFEFPVDDQRTGQGSLEAFKTTDASGRPSVQVKITTGAGPVYLPHSILDGLAAKVRAERGQPAPPPPPAPPPKTEEPEEPPLDGGPPPELPPSREPGDDPAG